MSFTYDTTTSRGRVRLLITDTDSTAYLFDDAEIDAFLVLAPGASVHRAAAQALEVTAASEILVQKRIKLLDLSTDGPAESKELRELAASYRRDAEAIEAAEDGGAFDIAEMPIDIFGQREHLWNERLRNL
jgi:hypothetical protein